MTKQLNVDPAEISKFEDMASRWWDLEGEFKPLHQINPLRLNFVIDHPRWYGIMHTAPEHLGMDTVPEDIEALIVSVYRFWIDRVRECMDAGIIREGDPEMVSITMWAHAHGLVQLYYESALPMTEDEFRRLFEVSGARLMTGVGTEEYSRELKDRVSLETGVTLVPKTRSEK